MAFEKLSNDELKAKYQDLYWRVRVKGHGYKPQDLGVLLKAETELIKRLKVS